MFNKILMWSSFHTCPVIWFVCGFGALCLHLLRRAYSTESTDKSGVYIWVDMGHTEKWDLSVSRAGTLAPSPPNQSNQSLVQRQSAGFPPAKAANCVWRDTRCRRLNPQPFPLRRRTFGLMFCNLSIVELVQVLQSGPPQLKVMWLHTVPKTLNLSSVCL